MSTPLLEENVRWPRASLDELGPITDGDWILTSDYAPSGVRLLQVGDIGRGVFLGKSSRFVSEARATELGCTLLAPGDILISRMPDPIGRACVLPDLGYPCITAVDVSIWRPDVARVDRQFVVSYLNSEEWLAEVSRHASGSTRERISRSKLQRIAVPVPPLAVQRTVAKRLQHAFAAHRAGSEAVREQLNACTALAHALFYHAFHGAPPISAGPPTNTPPIGWRWVEITAVARLESGHTPSRRHPEWWGGSVPWVALPDIRALDGRVAQDTAEHTNELGIANSSARVLPAGTVVMSRTASVGFVTVMGRPMATSQDFVNWVCGPELDGSFLAYALRASREYIRSLASGAVHKTVYMPTLHSLQICMPSIEEQRRIVRELDAQLGEVERLRSALRTRADHVAALPATILRTTFSPATAPRASRLSDESRVGPESRGIFFRRGAVASYIVDRLHDSPTFGRVMFQKLLYLAEAHVGVDLEGQYERRAAGPLAVAGLPKLESLAAKQGWFTAERREGGTGYRYMPGREIGGRVAAAVALLGNRRAEMDRLIDLIGSRKTEVAEIIATLFAVWNDFLLDGHAPADDEIVREVRENWHPSKTRFTADRLRRALDWMRANHIVPAGRKPRTKVVHA